MAGFVCKYLIMPIFQGTGYNPVNTLVLAGLFYLLALVSYRYLKSFIGLKSMDYFAWAALPYIVLGGVMRSLTDAGTYPGIAWQAGICGTSVNLSEALFVTPGAYALPLSILFIAVFLEKRLGKSEVASNLGWLLVAANLFLLRSIRTEVILGTLAVAGVVFAIAAVLYKILKLKFMDDPYSRLALAAQLFEGSATFVGVSFYGYGEQHVLAGLAIGSLGPASVFLVKMIAVPFVLWACSDLDDEETAKYVKILIVALGLGPGLRDMLSVAMGV